jgi:hypothetical protein
VQKGKELEFNCPACKSAVAFSPIELEKKGFKCACHSCNRLFLFDDPQLKADLKSFSALCYAIKNAERILGDVSVGVDVGQQQIKIPYKLLLTRLNPHLKIRVGEELVEIHFRMEPLKEIGSV